MENEAKNDIYCECCRCRNKHMESERLEVQSKTIKHFDAKDLVCPKCKALDYYRLNEDGTRAGF